MINKELVIKLADFLILNAYSVRNIGLYNGKIGLALCLFELADYLKEENIEEHAFEILQESLALSKKKIDISFNNGLSGIGFSLFYLIKNQLLDADFNELFEQQTHTVLKQIKILSDLNPYE